MAAATTVASAVDLKAPASYPIRLGKSILKPEQAKRYVNLRYNHKERPKSSDATCKLERDGRESGKSQLKIQESGEDNPYVYFGEDVGSKNSYVLVVNGQGKDAEVVLERLSGSHNLNLYRTPTDQDEDRVRGQHEQIRPANTNEADEDDLFGDEGEETPLDPNNPFDYRHFLRAAEEKAKTEAPRETAGTPRSSSQQAAKGTPPVKPKKRPEAPLYVPPTKRKAPVSAEKSGTKRVKPAQETSSTTPASKGGAKKQAAQASPPKIRVDRKASLRRSSIQEDDNDDGELILENEASTLQQPNNRSAMSLALGGQLASNSKGPVSLRSIASSPASHVASPAPPRPKHVDDGELELEGGDGDEDADADVEELELPSPVQEGGRKEGVLGGGGEGVVEGDEEDEDDLDAQLAAAMAEEDEGVVGAMGAGVAEEEEEESEEE